MKCIFAATLLSISLLSAPEASAQTGADAAVIDKCLQAAEESGSLGRDCIGLIADPCIKQIAETNEGVEKSKACAARELAVWTAKLNPALKKVQSGGFADIIKAVAESQKTFAASRDRFCASFDKIEPGMYFGGAAYCRMQETATRVLSLIKLGAAVNEH